MNGNLIAFAHDTMLRPAGSGRHSFHVRRNLDNLGVARTPPRLNAPLNFSDNFATSNYSGLTNTQTAAGTLSASPGSRPLGSIHHQHGHGASDEQPRSRRPERRVGSRRHRVEQRERCQRFGGRRDGTLSRCGDANMYWAALINNNGTITATVFRNVGGTWTLLAFAAAPAPAAHFRFEVVGTSLKLFLNSTLLVFYHRQHVDDRHRRHPR